MNASTLFRIRYSKDQAAYQEVTRLEGELASAGRRPFRRRALESQLEEANRRCLEAGVDWERAPRPPHGLRAPDRSGRVRVGASDARAPAGWKPQPPAGGKAPPLSLSGTLSFSSQAAAAAARPQATPTTSSPAAGASSAVAGAAAAAPTYAAGTGVAATAATAYGAADAGSFTTLAATQWLDSDPAPAFSDQAGNSWLEGPDGSLWFTDEQGAAYTVGADGNFFALSPDGMLYGQAPDGTSVTWAPDGTPLTMDDSGQLWAADVQGGEPQIYGEDGQFYAPEDAMRMVSYDDPLGGMLPGLEDAGLTEDFTTGTEFADGDVFESGYVDPGSGDVTAVDDPSGTDLSGDPYTVDEFSVDDYTGGDEFYVEDDGFSDGAYPTEDLDGDGWADIPDTSVPEPEVDWRSGDDLDWDA